ncbi:UNVERIFIED_CONTAM: hypothetical protein K2H54_040440 [Gekko kuhli]
MNGANSVQVLCKHHVNDETQKLCLADIQSRAKKQLHASSSAVGSDCKYEVKRYYKFNHYRVEEFTLIDGCALDPVAE